MSNEQLGSLKPKLGDVCPICGQPVTKPAIILTTREAQDMEQKLDDEAARQAVIPGEK